MMIQSLFLQPLGPAIVVALGAALLMLARRFGAWQMARVIAFRGLPATTSGREPWMYRLRLPAALLILLAAGGVLVILRTPAARPVLQWTWQPLTVAGSRLDWRVDSWNWLTALLLLLASTGALALTGAQTSSLRISAHDAASPHRPRLDRVGIDLERTLWLTAAALVFTSSANVLTLASSWVLLDVALVLRLRPSLRAEPGGRAWGLLSLAGVLLLFVLALLGEGGIRAELLSRSFDRWELALLWLAALMRAGIYPLHFWLIGPGQSDRSERVALSVIAPLAGLWLLGRLHSIAPPDWLRRPEWAALGAFALLGTALVAWTEVDEGRRWRWIALNRAGVVVLAAYMAGSAGSAGLAWALVTFGLGSTLLAVGQAAQQHLRWRAPVWLAVLALWGLPGTSGFLARWALVFPTELPVAMPLFGLIVLAEILLVAALWQAARLEGAPEKPWAPQWQMAVGLGLVSVLLAVPLVIWGLEPPRLAMWAGWPAGDAFPTLRLAVAQARKSVWAGLGASAVLGALLGLFRARIFAHVAGWQRGIAAIVGLEWLYRAVAFGFTVFANGLQYFARLGEGEGYLGWLALAGLILWVLLQG